MGMWVFYPSMIWVCTLSFLDVLRTISWCRKGVYFLDVLYGWSSYFGIKGFWSWSWISSSWAIARVGFIGLVDARWMELVISNRDDKFVSLCRRCQELTRLNLVCTFSFMLVFWCYSEFPNSVNCRIISVLCQMFQLWLVKQTWREILNNDSPISSLRIFVYSQSNPFVCLAYWSCLLW